MPGGGIAGLKARQQKEPIKLNAYKNSSHLLGRWWVECRRKRRKGTGDNLIGEPEKITMNARNS